MADMVDRDLQATTSWAEAESKSKGYDDRVLSENLLQEFVKNLPTRNLEKSSVHLPVGDFSLRRLHLILGFRLAAQGGNFMKVADIGGGNGYMYDWIEQSFPGFDLDWTVYESQLIAENYSKFGSSLGITFSDLKTLDSEEKFDLSIFSCVLQYLKNWDETLLKASKNSRYILVMRAPVVQSLRHNFFVQKNDSGVYGKSESSWPFIMFSKALFEQTLNDLGEIVMFCKDPQEVFPFGKRNTSMSSYLIKCQ